MRKNRSGIIYNQNEQQQANTSTKSNDIHSLINNSENLVSVQEVKIRNCLKELQSMVKNCQNVRSSNEEHLKSISKVHEKLKKEAKISPFYRKKLHSLYTKGVEDADEEIKTIKKALDCIKDVRTLQSEIHLIKTTYDHHATTCGSGGTSSSLLSSTNKDNKPVKAVMRRGVLMSILQQASLTLPLWIGEIGQNAPALCGSIPCDDDYICKIGDKVAAHVKNQEEENWILAEVVSYNTSTCKYDVDDIDAEDGQERHCLNKSRIVPLPLWRANPITDIEAIFPKDSIVLALYPQTTCFYRGIVNEPPKTPQDEYLILFEDSSYLEGYSPPLNVAQLYVVAYKESD